MGRGVPTSFGAGIQQYYTLYMSQSAVRNWGRILKFGPLLGSWTYENIPHNNEARKNFFIDRVRYVGIQPLDNNKPQEGIYTDPGHYDHGNPRSQRNASSSLGGASTKPKFGRGVFTADGNEENIKGQTDTFFKPGRKYIELSYAKIWAESSLMDIDQTKVSQESSYATAWNVGKITNSNHNHESAFVSKLKIGSKFRFSGDPNEKVYEIFNLKQERRYNHTVYPGGNGDYIVAVTKAGNMTAKTWKPSHLRNINHDNKYTHRTKFCAQGFGTGGTITVSERTYKRKFVGFGNDQSPHSNNLQIRGDKTIEDEEKLFGLATNRRLTWIIEFRDVTVTQNGQVLPDYSPVNEHTSRSQTGTIGTDMLMDELNSQFIEFVESSLDEENQLISDDPAVFETHPKTNNGLDIYYEASNFIDINAHGNVHELPWFNCYSFGNGVESNRIKDDFNQVFIDKNAVVSTTLQGEYEENQRKYGLIYSGIYNSKSGVNDTNQFIAAEKITKDINPDYGSIQKLYARNSDLLTLCEDKVLKIQANKDALFNADGNTNVTASSNVLGQTIPFVGDHGISKNPESFAAEAYRVYFTDKQRGAVLRLSMDGLTTISDYGMRDWFKDKLKPTTDIVGSYDVSKKEYNITLKGTTNYTVSYSEDVKGWASLKSFIPEQGLSVSGNYYTFATENGTSMVKTFKTLSYKGTQAKVDQNTEDTDNYYNLVANKGWYAETITTDQQTGSINEFLEKEGKWFNFIKGDTTTLTNLDTSEFTVQGLGKITAHDTLN